MDLVNFMCVTMALSRVLSKDRTRASASGIVFIGVNIDAATSAEWPILILTTHDRVLMKYEYVAEERSYHFRMKGDDRIMVVPFTDIHGEPN